MNITVCGIGYVGLANAILLAQNNKVTAFDISEEKIRLINERISPIEDKEIAEYLADKSLSINATVDKTLAFNKPDFVVIATPTDYNIKENSFDTSSVESVIREVSKLSPSSTVVIKSTVPIGFTARMKKKFPRLSMFFSPEFLREGKALYDNLYPSRIIIGDTTKKGKDFFALLLQGAKKKDVPVCYMPSTEAEAVKLFSNTYLALRISFFNELDTYSELMKLDSRSIIDGVCMDPRIGAYYNNPSFGYGGYCLPKDTHQIKSNYEGVPQSLISAIVKSNEIRKKHISDMIEKHRPKTAGIYRLAMKTDSDNYRSSAVLDVIKNLKRKGINVIIFDPAITKKELFKCRVINDYKEFIKMSDIIIANRITAELEKIKHKVYTRDVFSRD